MKTVTYILLYFILTIGYYLLLSTIGLLFGANYSKIIGCVEWFIAYLILIHWWLVISSLMEYYEKHLAKIWS